MALLLLWQRGTVCPSLLDLVLGCSQACAMHLGLFCGGWSVELSSTVAKVAHESAHQEMPPAWGVSFLAVQACEGA
jgi:hypothetical protein